MEAEITSRGALFPGRGLVEWEELLRFEKKENSCFDRDEEGAWTAVKTFSEETGRSYSLYPTAGAPTMLVSGVPMHRIKGTDPWKDTQEKMKALGAFHGCVLDTATGLGYTAILASEKAQTVHTVELDPAAVSIARRNPWSEELFSRPGIERHLGDSAEVVHRFGNGAFSAVIHDPPEPGLGGDLYSLEFYRELFRVLGRGGRLFHYVGNPESPSGARMTRGVVRRLSEAGFGKIVPAPRAFGVTAVKPG
ncbi:MAG: spermine synthase [Thermodesulfobacteriota bacterium]